VQRLVVLGSARLLLSNTASSQVFLAAVYSRFLAITSCI
jgi:hypothetical protein